jgi:hypothetical protein
MRALAITSRSRHFKLALALLTPLLTVIAMNRNIESIENAECFYEEEQWWTLADSFQTFLNY